MKLSRRALPLASLALLASCGGGDNTPPASAPPPSPAPAPADPPSPTPVARGSWSLAAPLAVGRRDFSLSTLPDGRLLVAGGELEGGDVTDTAALYDPALDTWTDAAPMAASRTWHSATVLSSGEVLVTGGAVAGPAFSASCELYKPATGTWEPAGNLAQGRSRHSATLQPDGQVLVVGGISIPGFLAWAERYTRASNAWAPAMTLSWPRAQHTAMLLPNGDAVLVAGGLNAAGQVTSAELYSLDPSAPITPLATAPAGDSAVSVRLLDGSVLVVVDGSLAAWRFHPATSTWTQSTLGAVRIEPTLTLLADGRVLLAGGANLDTAEIYHPDANAWTEAASMAFARQGARATLLADESVLVVGGFDGLGEPMAAVERFQP